MWLSTVEERALGIFWWANIQWSFSIRLVFQRMYFTCSGITFLMQDFLFSAFIGNSFYGKQASMMHEFLNFKFTRLLVLRSIIILLVWSDFLSMAFFIFHIHFSNGHWNNRRWNNHRFKKEASNHHKIQIWMKAISNVIYLFNFCWGVGDFLIITWVLEQKIMQ